MTTQISSHRSMSVEIATCGIYEVAELRASSDLVIDVRCLGDPSSKQLRMHPGCHPSILAGVVYHDKFAVKLDELKQCMGHNNSSILRVLVHCNAGKHRCIAYALSVQHIMHSLGVHCNVKYYGGWHVGRSCLEGSCSECTDSSRQVCFHDALLLWRGLS